jgi:hypothetical protein
VTVPRGPDTTSPDTSGPGASGTHTPGAPGWEDVSSSVRPRPVSAADRKAFEALVSDALPAVRSMVVAWRTGLTGFITLVTTGVVLTGQKTTTDLTFPWRVAVTLAIGWGLGLAILGLWHALAAEVGARTRLQSLEDIRARYASVQAYQVGLAAAAGHRLQAARTLSAAALGLLLTGVLLTWWAPRAPADPPAYLTVTRPGGIICGVLASADGGLLRVRVAGAHDPVTIPLSTVTNLAVATNCP